MEPGTPPWPSYTILKARVDAPTWAQALERIAAWAEAGESRYVCVANVHVVMEAYDRPDFRQVVNGADLVVPDGMPLVWMLRRMGRRGQPRLYGAELVLRLCEVAEQRGIPVGVYGSHPQTLARLLERLRRDYPRLRVVYAHSPPFRPLTPEEDAQDVEEMRQKGVRILFVSLGCPKQERWMADHRGRVPAVMLGVGAAVDFLTGTKPQAPRWMQQAGLEWLFRLLTEPRRLWRRYLKHNPRFLLLALFHLYRWRRKTHGRA